VFTVESSALRPDRTRGGDITPIAGPVLLAFVLVLSGCGTTKDTRLERSLSFSYQAIGEPGYMDQNLQIVNRGSSAVVPVLAYQATDKDGRALTDIHVSTAYGSDRGELVVPEGGWFEILSFQGNAVSEIIDVRVTVVSVEAVKYPIVEDELKTQFLDSEGEPTYGGPFDSVRLTNDGPLNVTVRVVFLVLDEPPPGTPQKPIRIVPLAGPTKVSGRSDVIIPVTPEVAGVQAEIAGQDVWMSVKAYPSH